MQVSRLHYVVPGKNGHEGRGKKWKKIDCRKKIKAQDSLKKNIRR